MRWAAPGLPEGMVTFVFTDIEGSTRLFRRLGGRYEGVLDVHNQYIRDAVVARDGHVVKSDGDAFLAAFADPARALAACADAQRALQANDWPPDGEMRVRIGVHTGLAYPREHDYVAYAVHQTARVVDAAHGGQTIATADAVGQVDGLAPDLSLRSLGAYRVRDFDEPVELFQLAGVAMADRFPALRVLPADRHNLVRPVTALVGRDSELAELARLLDDHRLVTVAGPGGVGKTRLVIELGLQVADHWPDGAWFVDLASVDHPSRLGVALADRDRRTRARGRGDGGTGASRSPRDAPTL